MKGELLYLQSRIQSANPPPRLGAAIKSGVTKKMRKKTEQKELGERSLLWKKVIVSQLMLMRDCCN
jgi:hypothetical protein